MIVSVDTSPKTTIDKKNIISVVSRTPLATESKCVLVLRKLNNSPKNPLIPDATIPKIQWNKMPTKIASKNPTIWLFEILLAKIPMLMYAALIRISPMYPEITAPWSTGPMFATVM